MNNQSTKQSIILISIISILIIFTVGSIVYSLIYDDISMSYKKIIEQCDDNNRFPYDKITVELTDFNLPSENKENVSEIRYEFKIDNTSGGKLNIKAEFFYDTVLDQYIKRNFISRFFCT